MTRRDSTRSRDGDNVDTPAAVIHGRGGQQRERSAAAHVLAARFGRFAFVRSTRHCWQWAPGQWHRQKVAAYCAPVISP